MTRVLVAVDETEDSVHAAQVAHRLFGEDPEYFAVNVATIPLDTPPVPWYEAGWGAAHPVPYGGAWAYRRGTVTSAASKSAGEAPDDAAAETARRVAEHSGLSEAEAIGELGDAADAIMRVADEYGIDVIVVGRHHRSWLSRLWQPSVSTAVVKHTELPVLVVG